MATRRIAAGQPVRRYNQIIGVSTRDIEPGQHVHTHNLAMAEFARDYAFAVDAHPTPCGAAAGHLRRHRPPRRPRRDPQLHRHPHQRQLLGHGGARHRRPLPPRHPPRGAGRLSQRRRRRRADPRRRLRHRLHGPAIKLLRRTLAGYARHPNFHSVLMIGLGCEANQIGGVMAAHGLEEGERCRVFTIQDTGGTTKTIARGIELIKEMLPAANQVRAHHGPGIAPGRRPAVRRLRRLFRHHRQPGAGRRGRPSCARTAARRSSPRRRRSTAPSTC